MADRNTATIGFEKQIWDAACVLRGNMDASEYKNVVLGLIFLKYISDRFDDKYQELVEEGDGFEEDIDEYTSEGIFFVPANARWSEIATKAHTPEIGAVIDDAMRAIEKENKRLKDILPKNFTRPELDKRRLGDVVDLFTNIQMIEHGSEKDILGRTYEYCLSMFAEQEGKRGGEFFTPSCVVRTLVEVLKPFKGSVFQSWLNSKSADGLGFVDAITGGSFSQMSVFALNITPYITSSIIMQLLTIAIPKLEEMQRDGEDGRKKIVEITRYLTIALGLLESVMMVIGFYRQNYLTEKTPLTVIMVVTSLTAGSAVLMWIGERITEKGVGNGISIVLTINIISRIPEDLSTLWSQFIASAANIPKAIVAGLIIVAIIAAMVVFVVLLQDAQRKIPVQYSSKIRGNKQMGGQQTCIPLKVNTSGVIPVIFAQSLMQTPVIIASFLGKGNGNGIGSKILKGLSQSNWCDPKEPVYSIGLIVYIVLIIAFAYFYTNITFNPLEIANNMKRSGGFIPGIRPGKPTSDYLNQILNYIVFIGAIGLAFIAFVPIFFNGVFNADVSFGGTSIIIIVGVVIETLKQIESQMRVRYYKGFLDD